MIKLVNVGSLNSALDYAADFCRNFDGQKVDVVVPDKLSLFMERNLFENLGICASFNINVSTLNRFAKRNSTVDKSAQISKIGSIILIDKILNQNAKNLKAITSHNYSFSYAEEIFKTIYQLKASKIQPEEMFNFSSSNTQLENKIKDLALIYSEYEKNKAGLLDASDQFLLSVFSVNEGRENHKILFVGFDDFTQIEYSLIEQLAKSCYVEVANYKGTGSNAHLFNQDVKTKLKNISQTCQIGFEEVEYNKPLSNLKQYLQSNLFGTENKTFEFKDEVDIFSASSPQEEIEFVARDIKQQILNGKTFSNFGVAVFDLPAYSNKIEEVFNKYEINYYIDQPFSINQSMFYKFVLSCFKFCLQWNNLDHLIDIISSPFFVATWQEKQNLIIALKNKDFKGKSLKNYKFLPELNAIVKNLTIFIDMFAFSGNQNIVVVIEKFNKFLQSINAQQVLQELTLKTELKHQILVKKSYEIVQQLFEEIVKFYPTATAEQLFEILLNIQTMAEINNLPLTLDAVKVVDANNFMEAFNNLYLVNCTLSNAPQLKHDCGIILDEEIQALNFSHKLSPTIAHINKMQKLRLFNTALMFNNNLTITYFKQPSELVVELKNKLTQSVKGVDIRLLATHAKTAVHHIALSRADYLCASAELGYVQDKKQIKNISSQNELMNFNNISASTLEHYFACPFYCFLSNFVKIRPRLYSEMQQVDVGNIVHQIVYDYYVQNKQVGEKHTFIENEIKTYFKNDLRLKENQNKLIINQLVKECERVLDGLDYIDAKSLFVPTQFEQSFANKTALNLGNANLIGKIDRIDYYTPSGQKNPTMFRIVDYKTGNAKASLAELYYGKKLQLFLYNLAIEQNTKTRGVGSFYLPLHNRYEKSENNNYSMLGFFENEHEVVSALDSTLQAGEKSDVVNLNLSNSGLAKNLSDKVLTPQQFILLKNYAKSIASTAVSEIKSGYIQPSPLEKYEACSYCPYAHICFKKANNVKSRKYNSVSKDSFGGENGN